MNALLIQTCLLVLGQTPPADTAKPAPDAPAAASHPAGPSTMEQLVSDPTAAVASWTKKIWGLVEIYGPRILGALVLLVAAFTIAAWARRFLLNILTRANVDLTLSKFLANVLRWTIIIFALITSAGTLGADTTGFAAAIAAAGLAIGLALQGNLGNLACGVLIMIFRPFKIGDSVIVAGQPGVIDGIDLFTTNLDTGDNRRVIVPNGQIFGGVIENQTHHPQRAAALTVTVAPWAPYDATQKAFLAAADRARVSTPGTLAEPAPTAVIADMGVNVTWTITVWTQTSAYVPLRAALLREIKRAVDEQRIFVSAPLPAPPPVPPPSTPPPQSAR